MLKPNYDIAKDRSKTKINYLDVDNEIKKIYNGKKYFAQGITDDDGKYVFGIQMWEPEEKLLWEITGKDDQESYEEFLKQPLFDGKTFWEIEKYTEWVDE